MPLAIVVFLSLFFPSLVVQQYVTLVCLLVFVLMIGQGLILGRQADLDGARRSSPRRTSGGFSIGWYAFSRASSCAGCASRSRGSRRAPRSADLALPQAS